MAYLLLGCRCVLALVFAASAFGKLRAPARFVEALRDLDVLPGWLNRPAAWAALLTEAALVGLVWLPGGGAAVAFAAAAVLLAAFSVVLMVLVRRGDDASCACFGASATPVGLPHVVRNLLLLGVAGLGAAQAAALPSGGAWPAAVPAACLAALVGSVVAVLVISTDTLVSLFSAT